MKLKHFNSTNCHVYREHLPTMRISQKSGTIAFSKQTCINLGLKNGSRVELVQDEDSPKDWYIIPTKLEDAFLLRDRSKSNHTQSTVIQSTNLAREILKSLNINAKSCSFLIAKEPTEQKDLKMFAIITKSANISSRHSFKSI